MGKKLAIRGHATRGKEVIELLQMMGGTNPFSKNDGMVIGNKTTNCYYISEDTASKYISWDYIGPEEIEKYDIFTLDEFLEKYPFKVGDKVRDDHRDALTIKSMWWHDELETMVYDFEDSDIVLTLECLLKYNAEFLVNKEKSEEVGKMLCDITLNHLHRISLKNVLSELYEHIKTTSNEELEREFKEIESEEWTNVGPTVEEFRTFCECVNRKPKYPKTYEECCKITEDVADASLTCFACNLLNNFQKLLLCRDAYWEIAGEEMGLGKPWKPDWTNETTKYGIQVYQNTIIKDNFIRTNCAFVFPTPEIRDAFYDNFKKEIEQCKELL